MAWGRTVDRSGSWEGRPPTATLMSRYKSWSKTQGKPCRLAGVTVVKRLVEIPADPVRLPADRIPMEIPVERGAGIDRRAVPSIQKGGPDAADFSRNLVTHQLPDAGIIGTRSASAGGSPASTNT